MRTPPGSPPQQFLLEEQISGLAVDTGFSSHETVAGEKAIRVRRIRTAAGLIVPFGWSIVAQALARMLIPTYCARKCNHHDYNQIQHFVPADNDDAPRASMRPSSIICNRTGPIRTSAPRPAQP